MSLYTDLRAQVATLLAELGRSAVFRRYTNVTDVVEGTVAPTLQASQTLRAAVLPASDVTLEAFDVRFMADVEDDTNVRFALVSCVDYVTGLPATFRPGPKDVADLYGDGREWLVLGCTPVNVDGLTDVVYSIGFRLP